MDNFKRVSCKRCREARELIVITPQGEAQCAYCGDCKVSLFDTAITENQNFKIWGLKAPKPNMDKIDKDWRNCLSYTLMCIKCMESDFTINSDGVLFCACGPRFANL